MDLNTKSNPVGYHSRYFYSDPYFFFLIFLFLCARTLQLPNLANTPSHRMGVSHRIREDAPPRSHFHRFPKALRRDKSTSSPRGIWWYQPFPYPRTITLTRLRCGHVSITGEGSFGGISFWWIYISHPP